ncbi:Hydrolase FUB4 [Paramyrothecium foliicola]|nr:Hydrolase FUB4 [Paramyrothecium foliicola]
MQTAAFRYELADLHTYEFVQGVVPWEAAPELAAFSNTSTQHYSYYDLNSQESFVEAMDSLEAYIEAEGPFDGVMAYSQGAGLVTMLLVRRYYLRPEKPSLFRCAILFSPVQVYDFHSYMQTGELKLLDGDEPRDAALSIPVVVVYGEADDRKAECRGVQTICDPKLMSIFVHKGGHEIPGAKDKNELLDAVMMARRGITNAELST